MAKLLHRWFGCALVAAVLTVGAHPQDSESTTVFHPPGASFQRSLGEVLFSPDGRLYVAYRLRGEHETANVLRIASFDPTTGRQLASGDFTVPEARLPRVASQFVLSQDGTALVYAELHNPQMLVTVDAGSLGIMSSSDQALFGALELSPHIEMFNRNSLLLSAELLRPRRPAIVEAVRELTLDPADLRQVLSEKKVPHGECVNQLDHWTHLTGEEIDFVLPIDDGVLAVTRLMKESWIHRFNAEGKAVASLHTSDCAVTAASLSSDKRFAIAVCERTEPNESHVMETKWRKALVLDVSTLTLLRSMRISHLSLKERGPRFEDVWVAVPSPAIWHGNHKLLVAIPDFSDVVKLYSLPIPSDSR